jgi:benzoylformate decarboxylase
MLAQATKPLVIVGDGIAYSNAQAELTHVAELIGAQVWGSDSSEPNMNATHPLYGGLLGHMFGEVSSRTTSQADVVLICGTYVFPEVFPALSDVFAPGAKIVHIDLNAYEIAKNFPVDLGLVSDPKTTLAKLGAELAKTLTPEQKRMAGQRTTKIAEIKQQAMNEQFAADQAVHDFVPLHLSQFAEELARHLPPNAIVFDEALTHSEELCRYIPPTTLGHYFQTRGGSLGVGIPGAIGIKLSHPDKTVIGFTGDGGAMYTIQALWTAAHHNIDAKFVICNNRSYRILKLNILQYWQEQQIEPHEFPASFDLCKPALQFDELARAMGVQAVRVETPEEIKPAIAQALFHNGPFLIDLVIGNEVPGSPVSPKCGQ